MTMGIKQLVIGVSIALWGSWVSAAPLERPTAVALGFTVQGDVPVAAVDHASDALRAEAGAALGGDHTLLQLSDASEIPAGVSPALTLSGVITALPSGAAPRMLGS